ncbi:MAG: glycosyltransferase family 39 protein [Anaerolineae bacterium]|nr:glycosyltransferase family 39 protein [Anaerolineae bacterium]
MTTNTQIATKNETYKPPPADVTLRNSRLSTRQMWLVGAGIVLLGLLLRAIWAAPPRAVRWDEADMLVLAQNLLRGVGYQVQGPPELHWPPGAPYLAALSMVAGVTADRALTVWHVLAGALGCGLLFGLASDVTGNWRTGALAGLLLAVSPALAVWPLYWGSNSESLFLAFLLAGLWATWRMLHGGRWRTGLAGGLGFGAAYLVRPEGMIYWLLFLGLALLLALARRTDWRAVALFALAFLILATPYIVYLQHTTGRLMVSGKAGITTTLGAAITDQGSALGEDAGSVLDSTGQEILWLSPEQFDISWLDSARADPELAARRLARNLMALPGIVLEDLANPLLLVLAFLGLFARPWNRETTMRQGFWLACLLPLAVVPLFHVHARLLTPLVPVLLVWAAEGMLAVADWARGTAAAWPRMRPLVTALLAGVLIVVLLGGVWSQRSASLSGQATLFPSHQQAGQWLSANSQPGEPVMTRNTEIGLYADRPQVALPNATWEEIVAYGAARGARFLVIDDWEVETVRPQLSPLLLPSLVPPEVTMLQSFEDERRTTYVLGFEP